MLTFFRQWAGVLAATGLAMGASSGTAAVLYDNGPLNGSVAAYAISSSVAVSDSFTLAAAATVNAVDFGVWTYTGDTISTVDWGISTAPGDFTNFISSGTAAVFNGAPTINASSFNTSVDSFNIGPLKLGPGTYYLVLQNAVATNGDGVYWDESDGLSTAVSSFLGDLASYAPPGKSGSQSFQILGVQGVGAPEPGSWVLMMIGLCGLGGALRARALRTARSQ